jgi:hypothetical protein
MSIVSGVQLDKLPIVLDILNGAGSLDNVQNSKALSPVIKIYSPTVPTFKKLENEL